MYFSAQLYIFWITIRPSQGSYRQNATHVFRIRLSDSSLRMV